jgi:hypothetical protein
MRMKINETFRKLVAGVIIQGMTIGGGLVVIGSALVPAVASASSVTADEIRAIEKRLVNASTREELLAAIREAKSAGAPWQYPFREYGTLHDQDRGLLDAQRHYASSEGVCERIQRE